MCTFNGWDDSFCFGKVFEGFHGFFVGYRHILGAADVVKVGVLRTDSRVVQTCGNGVNWCDLTVLILTEIGFHSVENAKPACGNGSGCLCGVYAAACCLTANELHIFVFNKVIEGSDSIGAAANTCKDCIWKPAFFFQHLLLDFFGDNCLEIADNGWERVRAHNGAQYIMGICYTVSPFTHGLGYGIFQSGSSGGYRMNFCSKETHLIYI